MKPKKSLYLNFKYAVKTADPGKIILLVILALILLFAQYSINKSESFRSYPTGSQDVTHSSAGYVECIIRF